MLVAEVFTEDLLSEALHSQPVRHLGEGLYACCKSVLGPLGPLGTLGPLGPL